MKKKKVVIITFAAIVVVAACGAGIFAAKHKQTVAKTMVQKTQTLALSKMDLVDSISATGTIESANTKTVSVNANNMTIKEVRVKAGDTVQEGDVLAVLDVSDLEDSLADAKENLSDTTDDADTQIADAKDSLADAEDTYATEKTKQAKKVAEAKSTYETAKSEVAALKKKLAACSDAAEKTALNEQLSKAQETLSQAKSAYEQAQETQGATNKQNASNVTNAKKQVTQAQKSKEKAVKEANQQVEQAQDALDQCEVTAPISGTVTAVNVEEGDTYSGGEMFQIDDTSSFTVTTSVDEYDISSVSVGQRVVILTEATDETELEGEITFVAPAASTSQSMAGSSTTSGYEVDIAVKTTDDRLRIGMTAKCSIVCNEADDVYAVPYDAVHEAAQGSYILVAGSQDAVDDKAASDSQTAGGQTGADGQAADDKAAADAQGSDGQTGSDSQAADDRTTGRSGARNQAAADSQDADNTQKIYVTKGMETDYYVEISGDGLQEGLQVVIPTDAVSTDAGDSTESTNLPFGGGDGGFSGGQMPSDGAPSGGPSGGAPGGRQ